MNIVLLVYVIGVVVLFAGYMMPLSHGWSPGDATEEEYMLEAVVFSFLWPFTAPATICIFVVSRSFNLIFKVIDKFQK